MKAKELLKEAAEEIRNLASDGGRSDADAEFLLNLAAVVEHMDPAPMKA